MADNSNTKALEDCTINELILQLATQQVIAKEGDIDLTNQAVMLEVFQNATKLLSAETPLTKEELIAQIKETRQACIDNGCGPTSDQALESVGVEPAKVEPTVEAEAAQSTPKPEVTQETQTEKSSFTYEKAIEGNLKTTADLNVAKMQEIINKCGRDEYSAGKVDGYTGKNSRRGADAFAKEMKAFGIESEELNTAIENLKIGNVTDADVKVFETSALQAEAAKQKAAEVAAEAAVDKDRTKKFQDCLKELGGNPGQSDGILGDKTKAATVATLGEDGSAFKKPALVSEDVWKGIVAEHQVDLNKVAENVNGSDSKIVSEEDAKTLGAFKEARDTAITAAKEAAKAKVTGYLKDETALNRANRATQDKDAVKALQDCIKTGVDGDFGPKTERAVKNAQRLMGVEQTGQWDKTTDDAFIKLQKDAIDAGKTPEEAQKVLCDMVEADAAERAAQARTTGETVSGGRSTVDTVSGGRSTGGFPTKAKCGNFVVTYFEGGKFGRAVVAEPGEEAKTVNFRSAEHRASFMNEKAAEAKACGGWAGQKSHINQYEREDGIKSKYEIDLARKAVRETLDANGLGHVEIQINTESEKGLATTGNLCAINTNKNDIKTVTAFIDGRYPRLGANITYCPTSEKNRSIISNDPVAVAPDKPTKPKEPEPKEDPNGKGGKGKGKEGGEPNGPRSSLGQEMLKELQKYQNGGIEIQTAEAPGATPNAKKDDPNKGNAVV